jgi:multicomponent Na+:H+ antiporter subunit F
VSASLLQIVLACVALILLATFLLGLIRVWRGPARADRMLTAQLFGTTGIALLLVLGELENIAALRNAALLLALLAVISTAAFAEEARNPPAADSDGNAP